VRGLRLLADAGSTKTRWVALPPQTIDLRTAGLNPEYHSDAFIQQTLAEVIATCPEITELTFYGAGCSSPTLAVRMRNALQTAWPGAAVQVHHDLVGTARSLLGNEPGLIGILGTGSSAAAYDGQRITQMRGQLGYLLEDFGSGNALGRALLRGILHQEAPHEVEAAFRAAYGEPTAFLQRVYASDRPNTLLAQLARLVHDYQGLAFMERIIQTCFKPFFAESVRPLLAEQPGQRLALSGSVAAAFAPQLHQVAHACGLEISMTVADPVAGLLRYHAQVQ